MEPNFELPDDISPTGPWRSAPPMTDDPALPALEILRGPRGDARGPVALACDEAPGQVGSSPRANPRALSGGPRRWRPERSRFESRRRRQSGGQSPRPDKDPGAIAELGPRHAVCSSHL